MEHPQLSQWAAERKLCLILWDSARIPRIVIGDSWGNNSTRMADRSDMTERIYAYQSTVRMAECLSASLVHAGHIAISIDVLCTVIAGGYCRAPSFSVCLLRDKK